MRRTIAAAAAASLVVMLAATSGQATTSAPQFSDPVKVGTGVTEPGINIGPPRADGKPGTIFVDGPSGLGAHSRLWRSLDGGDSYQAVVFGPVFNRFPGGGDSDVAIRGDRIYYLDLWLGSNSVMRSDDNGATWVAGSPYTTLPVSDRQWMTLGPRDPVTGHDTVYVLYSNYPHSVAIARSRDSGQTWLEHDFAPSFMGSAGATGQLVSDGTFLAFAAEDGSVIRVFTSNDEGRTWRSTNVGTRGFGIIHGVTLDGNDIHVAWVDRDNYDVHVRSSTDRGLTFGPKMTVSAPGTSNVFPWVEARGGKVAVAWYGADVDSKDPNSVGASTVWYARYAESLDRGATFSTPVTIGQAKTGIVCTGGLGCDSGRELGDFMSLAIDENGKSLVAYGGRVAVGVRVARQI